MFSAGIDIFGITTVIFFCQLLEHLQVMQSVATLHYDFGLFEREKKELLWFISTSDSRWLMAFAINFTETFSSILRCLIMR